MELFCKLAVFVVVIANVVSDDPFTITIKQTTKPASSDPPTTTSITAPPATTPPLPSGPNNYTFYVRNADGSACIMANMGTRFQFNTTDEQIVDLQVAEHENNVTGVCNDTTQTMKIDFKHGSDQWHMTLTFKDVSGSFSLDSVTVEYKTGSATANTGALNVKAVEGHSYLCKRGVNVTNFQPQPNKLISTFFSNLQVEAYRKSGSPDLFSSAYSCESDTVNQLVPIIVGAALAGLVIIVLIAYLVGRARNRRAGYESV